MKLVIEISKELYEYAKNKSYTGIDELDAMDAIAKGKPLEEKIGHWIKYGIPRCGEQHYKCTSCGYYINFGQWGELYTKEFKYCPNCGCRMVEEQESEDKE